MNRKLLLLLLSLASLALVSCGGGNDVASSGASAVSAAATDSSSTGAPLTTTASTEPKVNGQIDERTGVAPVGAAMTIGGSCYYGRAFNIQDGISCRTADGWGLFYPTANGGCANSSSFGYSGPALTVAQQAACNFAIYGSAPGIGVYTGANLNQCNSLGAVMNLYQNSCASSGQIPACFIPYQVNGSIINAC